MVESFTDYYGILGVPRYTNAAGIRRAYIRKAWLLHPDIHPDDPEAASDMSEINLAYTTLSDPSLRTDYDAQRVTIRIQPHQDHPGPRHTYRVSNRCHSKKDIGILDAAFIILGRLIRYATAVLSL